MAFISPCKPVISVIAALDELLAAEVPPPPPQAEVTERMRINSKVKKKFSFIISPKELTLLFHNINSFETKYKQSN